MTRRYRVTVLTETSWRLDLHEEAILKLFEQIKALLNPPPQPRKRRIGF